MKCFMLPSFYVICSTESHIDRPDGWFIKVLILKTHIYHTACMKMNRYPDSVNTTVTLQGVNSISANEREAQSRLFCVFSWNICEIQNNAADMTSCSVLFFFASLNWLSYCVQKKNMRQRRWFLFFHLFFGECLCVCVAL